MYPNNNYSNPLPPRTIETRYVNADLNARTGTSPMRYTESINPGFQTRTNKLYQTTEIQPGYSMTKSIGTFGQNEVQSSPQIQSLESNSSMTNLVNDLNAQIRRLTEKSDQLYNENRVLKKDSDSLVICRGRLEEKENELKKTIANNNFLENNIKNLKVELDKAYEQNRQSSNQLADVFNKNPGRFHMDQNSKKIMSAEEYELERKVKNLEEKIVSIEKERDRLFIKNYEYKKLTGEDEEHQEAEELLGMRYQNGMQIVNMDLNKAKKKIESLSSENELIRNELNILRGIDCFEENEVKSIFNRNDD